jgi:hypothetical protein
MAGSFTRKERKKVIVCCLLFESVKQKHSNKSSKTKEKEEIEQHIQEREVLLRQEQSDIPLELLYKEDQEYTFLEKLLSEICVYLDDLDFAMFFTLAPVVFVLHGALTDIYPPYLPKSTNDNPYLPSNNNSTLYTGTLIKRSFFMPVVGNQSMHGWIQRIESWFPNLSQSP